MKKNKQHGFFQCDNGNKSSRRLIGIPAGFLTLILSAIVIAVCLKMNVSNTSLIKFTLLFLGMFTLITLGLTSVDKLFDFIKKVKGGDNNE